jgi:hypothetical protein
MVLASTILVPELQYWFNNFVTFSIVNKNEVPAPVPVDEIFLPKKSFIEMLFNENYSYDEYITLYKEELSKSCWPQLTASRLCIYPSSAKYMILDVQGANFFNLQNDDLILLDALLAYREDSTSVTIIDSATLSFDTTANILYANFNILQTTLSKLIFLYLDLKIYGNYQNYDNLLLVTTGTLLETMFETLLIDEYFAYMTDREVDVRLSCPAT